LKTDGGVGAGETERQNARRAEMKRFILLVSVLFLLAVVGGSSPEGPTWGPPAHLKTTVDGNSDFALELYGRLKDQDGNLFLSPYSISAAMAIAYGGARGETEKQIAATLHFDADQKKFHSAMSEIRRSLTGSAISGKVELAIANGLWPQQDYGFRDNFLKLTRANYDAGIDFVDFPASPAATVGKINAWVARQTKNKITGVLRPNDVTDQTRLVIANAIYFKGDWASQFSKGDTRSKPFWIASENFVQTPMMRQQHVFAYAEAEGVQLLLLPYVRGNLGMIIVLPQKRDGLPEVEKRLDSKELGDWLKLLRPRTVDVLLPKFAMESRFSLPATLRAMGMSNAFDERADFTGMTPRRPLFINAVEHAALVEVDEQGTVAAAATSISFGCSASPSPPPATFHADHPFFFLIGDLRTRTVLFLGRLANPGT
jgi:serine protease inhibitor